MVLLLSIVTAEARPRGFDRKAATRTATAVESEWKLAFELAFRDTTPFSRRFPSLYDERLSYEVRRAITRDVLDRIVSIALRETGAKRVELAYRPGGYNDFPVVPSAQLIVRASDASVHRALSIIGYLAQQTAVIASKKTRAGNRHALEIVEHGSRRLAEREWLEKFWRRLASLSPKLGPGFSSIEVNGRPGLYIINSDGDWKAEDLDKFSETVRAVSKEFELETSARRFEVKYVEIGNDWKANGDGASYLDRLGEAGGAGLRRRLVRRYQPQVERWLEQAFLKHAPAIYKRGGAVIARSSHPARLLGFHSRPDDPGDLLRAGGGRSRMMLYVSTTRVESPSRLPLAALPTI
jgi:hypothetical protein